MPMLESSMAPMDFGMAMKVRSRGDSTVDEQFSRLGVHRICDYLLDPHDAVADGRHRAVDRGVHRGAQGRLAVAHAAGGRRPAPCVTRWPTLRPPARRPRRCAASA